MHLWFAKKPEKGRRNREDMGRNCKLTYNQPGDPRDVAIIVSAYCSTIGDASPILCDNTKGVLISITYILILNYWFIVTTVGN